MARTWQNDPPQNLVTKGVGAFGRGMCLDRANGIFILVVPGAPVSGVNGDGAGWAGPGSVMIRSDTGAWYRNSNTKASPTWTEMSTP